MSKIKRLSIKGIRNFSDAENEINFRHPITLILGENGTGKTTIIECLRFATTGEYPPNSDKGKSFVTDPALCNMTMIRAAIKLEFESKKGEILTIYRSMELKRTPHSLSIQCVDNTLSRYNKETKKVTNMSNRCVDTNAMVTEMMGVSKAILNYVIFCHQDDSFWPLEGGKELREKMDEIFDTTKYNKVLEESKNQHKEYTAKLKLLKSQKSCLQNMVDEIEGKESKLNNDKKRQEDATRKINNLDNSIKLADDELAKLDKIIETHNKKVTESNNKRLECQIAENEVEYLESNIAEVFEGTDDELKAAINSFQNDYSEQEIQMESIKMKLEDGLSEEKEITSSLHEQKITVGTLQQKMKDHYECIAERNQVLKTALQQWDISPPNEIEESDAETLIEQLSKKRSDFEHEIEQQQIERESEEKTLQDEIDTLRSESSAKRSEFNFKEQEYNSVQNSLQQLRKDILNVSTAANQLRESESKLDKATEEYEKILKEVDTDAIKKEIDEYIKLEKNGEETIMKLDTEIALLNRHQTYQSEINVHQVNYKSKMDQIKAISEEHEEYLKLILKIDEVPMEKLRSKVEVAQQKLNSIKANIKRDIDSASRQLSSYETTLKHQENDLKRRTAEIEDDKKKVSVYCDYNNYDEEVTCHSAKLKSLRDQKGLFAYQRIAYEKYLKEVTERKPCCPLCTRNFKADSEIKEFKRRIQTEMDQNPSAIEACEKELENEEMKYNSLLQLKSTVVKILQFENIDSKKMKKEIEETRERLENIKDKIKMLNESLLEPEEKLRMCEVVVSDIALWDQCIDDMEKLKRKIKALQNTLQYKTESSRTLDEAQAERESYMRKIIIYRKKKDELRLRLEQFNNKKQRALEMKQSLYEKVLNIRSEMQKVNQLREKEKELTTKINPLHDTMILLRDNYLLEEEKLRSASEKLRQFKMESQNIQKNNKSIISREQEISFTLSSYQKKISEYTNLEIESKLKKCTETIEKLQERLNDVNKENVKLNKSLERLKSEFSGQEAIKKNLLDNVDLRKKQRNLEKLKLEYREIKRAIESMGYDRVLAEVNKKKQEKSVLIEKRYEAKGLVNEITRGIDQLEKDLAKESTKTCLNDYKNSSSQIIIIENLISDLRIFMETVDQAMTSYHQDRMNNINKTMSSLWSSVYKGQDTTNIQITAESTGKIDSLRRVFNYKLVQTKHNVQMEMRGRCSAGQKVLASIIIRMALAEAFCADCAVLALDEPTTNLDVHNSHSLAQAIMKIVELRSRRQKNFQLILITHDEEFLKILASLDPDKAYYKLERSLETGRTVVTYEN